VHGLSTPRRCSVTSDEQHEEPAEITVIGVGIQTRRPRNTAVLVQLLGGPFLAAFDAGIDEVTC
jgi:hypothetical protein